MPKISIFLKYDFKNNIYLTQYPQEVRLFPKTVHQWKRQICIFFLCPQLPPTVLHSAILVVAVDRFQPGSRELNITKELCVIIYWCYFSITSKDNWLPWDSSNMSHMYPPSLEKRHKRQRRVGSCFPKLC